jgi:hypothetical protein
MTVTHLDVNTTDAWQTVTSDEGLLLDEGCLNEEPCSVPGSPDTLYTSTLQSCCPQKSGRNVSCTAKPSPRTWPPTPSSPRTRTDWPSIPSCSPARILDVMGFNERLREMYLGGRPGAAAKRANHRMARLAATGLLGWWLIRLDTVNPKSGTVLSLPLATAKVDGRRYVVSMLGQGARWVRNVLAADGHVVIRVGRSRDVVLTMVDVNLRAPIIKNYLQRAPGGRPHIPVDKDAPLSDFDAVAAAFPVFEIHPAEPRRPSRPQ